MHVETMEILNARASGKWPDDAAKRAEYIAAVLAAASSQTDTDYSIDEAKHAELSRLWIVGVVGSGGGCGCGGGCGKPQPAPKNALEYMQRINEELGGT